MMNTNYFVYVLRIVGNLLDDTGDNDTEDYVIVTKSKSLAINIALTKLVCAKAYINLYQRYCRQRAVDFPTLAPLSYNDWLADAIASDKLNGTTITEKLLVTYDNVGDLVL